MVQAVGYGVGAAGPLLVGILHGWTGGFESVGLLFAAVGVLAVGFGIQAGRPLYVKGVLHEIRVHDRILASASA
jgi:CP family cyanate transporter-like MFS transporter